ncbi:MAG: hypothetical protein LBI19_06840 [Oscillospiraceae bacterium]|jgi:hypothetical protein|nr:hypothetical protein [Oscillospiraceae bacterium]
MPPKSLTEQIQDRKLRSKQAQETPLPDDPANRALDREYDAQFNLMSYAEDVVLVSINQLRPYL